MALSETVRIQVRFSEVDSIHMVWHSSPISTSPSDKTTVCKFWQCVKVPSWIAVIPCGILMLSIPENANACFPMIATVSGKMIEVKFGHDSAFSPISIKPWGS